MRAAAATAGETACVPRAGGERARERESYTQHIKKDSRNREREIEGEREIERKNDKEKARERERARQKAIERAGYRERERG